MSLSIMSLSIRSFIFAIPAAVVLVQPVAAQDIDPALDADGDGMFSFVELTAGYPDLTEDAFQTMDTSGDGMLDIAEVAAAVAAGMIAPAGG